MIKKGIIDIGSNSVRLALIADGKTLYKRLETTRLGALLQENKNISFESERKTIAAISRFRKQAISDGADGVFAFATAAVRRAENGREFVKKVKELCYLDVDVISGETEAKIGLIGALGGKAGGVIDVGGASTEISVSDGEKIVYTHSLDVGTVRLYDACGEDYSKLCKFIEEKVQEYGKVPQSEYCAIGGTATSLAAFELGLKKYDAQKVDGLYLSEFKLSEITAKLKKMTKTERICAGIDTGRADIILGGAALLEGVVRYLNADGVRVSEQDNIEGYYLEYLV